MLAVVLYKISEYMSWLFVCLVLTFFNRALFFSGLCLVNFGLADWLLLDSICKGHHVCRNKGVTTLPKNSLMSLLNMATEKLSFFNLKVEILIYFNDKIFCPHTVVNF